MVMNKMRESPLVTPDPYHIPRYLGYVPQFKYQIGNTYGQTTHNLMKDRGVATSGNTVLANIDMAPRVQPDNFNEPGSLGKVRAIENRMQSFGDRKYHTRMVPGYTGFIPRGQHVIGKRYGQHCVNAVADFIDNQNKRAEYQAILRKEMTPCRMPQRGSYPAEEMKLYVSKDRPPFPISPYKMSNDNIDKYFVSGYTGFCPRSRSLLGMGYPEITHQALNNFTDDLKKNEMLKTAPTRIHRAPEVCPPSPVIYPERNGMIPHYTGYIPGEKFRFGHTYGCSTTGTLQKTGLRPGLGTA